MKHATATTTAIAERTAANGNSWEARDNVRHLRSVIREWQDGFDDGNSTPKEATA